MGEKKQMGFAHYISETEATSIAGVSAKTLERFAEAGYLSIETESDGLKLYSAEELKSVFRLASQKNLKPDEAGILDETPPLKPKKIQTFKDSSTDDGPIDNVVQFKNEKAQATIPKASSSPKSTVVKDQQEQDKSIQEDSPVIEEILSDEETLELEAALEMIESAEINELKKKISQLEMVNEVQEKIIGIREEQLEKAQKDCEWLRTLVDKLEEKSERAQLLHLSETQMLRQFIDHQRMIAERSPVRATLEWLGIIDPKPTTQLPNPLSQRDVVVNTEK